jgi:hypothetical protein
MIINGTIIEIFDTVQITEKFKKREFVLQTKEQYPQEILIQTIQDKCEILDAIKKGEFVDVSINLQGKGYTNKEGVKKWFNSLNAWKIDVQYSSRINNAPEPLKIPTPIEGIEQEDDLPF